jgi:SSS family solute:Na+ symporter
VGTLDKAKEKYKGSPANELEGQRVVVTLRRDKEIQELGISSRVAGLMSAEEGDVVYLSDSRRWLGGLRSVHAKISAIHDESPQEVWISPDLIERGNLIINRRHRIEKII